ncbi:protein 5NUC-like [Bacillus rossius redtenbacheri]|uniref:protein 5NUC-like n=1 Tax=Bacillus rossius redtenbacheri TaxID=93214 RepID=UPI002FDE15FB
MAGRAAGRSLVAPVALVALVALVAPAAAELRLAVLHTNDMHARFEQTNALSATCAREDAAAGRCYGGVARLAAAVARERAAPGAGDGVLLLNAGDTFQGTVWYAVHKWRVAARFVNLLGFDAISLGNHEFDDGVAGLLPFINNVTCPVLCSNLDLRDEPALAATPLANSTVITVRGVKVGVIGYLTPDTKALSNTGKVRFMDEVVAVTRESERLQAQGVHIIIALGHSGFKEDQAIARQVPLVDLVIGGHTNTFLYTGKQPDSEVPEGLYPTVVTQASGKRVPVVQAYAYTKYLGKLHLVFDEEGELQTCEGNPILLDGSVPQDKTLLAELALWRGEIQKLENETIGRTAVLLDGDRKSCRLVECNFGNLITDAMVDYRARDYVGSGWTDSPIAIIQGGGIRNSIEKSTDAGMSRADVLSALPFDNPVIKVVLRGEHLLEMLEWSVYNYDPSEAPGGFLQLSGLRVSYDLSRPAGSRLVSAHARCADCRVPQYRPVSRDASYGVLASSFLTGGGDGFVVLRDHAVNSTVLGSTDVEVVVDYISRMSPVYPALQGRIVFQGASGGGEGASGGGEGASSASLSMPTLPTLLAPACLALLARRGR